MKHMKTYEAKDEEQIKKEQEKVDILGDLLSENPDYETHDFYVFLASDKFKETKGGLYKKELDIENMVRITPDLHSLSSMAGLEIRSRFQPEIKMYNIWLPKEAREDIEGKSSSSMESWLVGLIDKNKRQGGDEQGKQSYTNAKQRRNDLSKFNL